MMTREEFLSSKGYWLSTIQLDLYNQLEQYMEENKLNRTQLAEKLGVTKGYISQILNGDFDHKISKLVDLALLMGKAPEINYMPIAEYIERDKMKTSDNVFVGSVRGVTRLAVVTEEKADEILFGNMVTLTDRKLA